LIRLAQDEGADLSAALRAFHAELEQAQWRSHSDVLTVYPRAEIEAHRFIIPLDERHCVVVALNYELGIAVIEYAGSRTNRTRKSSILIRVCK
jgi:mRNA-degrading endonuclease HigB of HigAB toxin-antitoxin module